MEQMIAAMAESALFAGIEPEELWKLLGCLSAQKRQYHDQEIIWAANTQIRQVGLVLEGRVYLEAHDFWGNKSIYAEIPRCGSFGEAYALSEEEPLPFNAVAQGESAVLFLDIRRMVWMCENGCMCHRVMNEHLLRIVADQSKALNRKIKHLSARTTREKLLSYFSEEARRQKTPYITLPFNRQELADYLSVERSAMSRELSRMKADGLIDYSRNVFLLRKSKERSSGA